MSEARLARQMGATGIEVINFGGTVLKTVIAIDSHPATARLAGRLNGDTQRAVRLFYTKAREQELTGAVTQAQIIRHRDSSRQAVIGVQSGDSDPAKRVRAFFSHEGNQYTLRAICRASEDGKALDALAAMGYLQGQRTGRY